MSFDLNLVRAAAFNLLAALMLAGCTYGPPVYEGKMDSVALMGDGRVAVGYSQMVTRRPTGLAAWPDGGAAKVQHNQVLVALVNSDGRTREIARYDNDDLIGKGSIQVSWYEADPGHLYVGRGGQLTTSLPVARLSETYRIDLNGRESARFDLRRELGDQGRDVGAKGFGGEVVDANGTMLVGATRGDIRELWRRNSDGSWNLLDQFDHYAEIIGSDLVYQLGDDGLARNWRTGEVRKVWRFNRSTMQSEVLLPRDPTLPRNSAYQPTTDASIGGTDNTIKIMRDNTRIAVIEPDFEVLDRR